MVNSSDWIAAWQAQGKRATSAGEAGFVPAAWLDAPDVEAAFVEGWPFAGAPPIAQDECAPEEDPADRTDPDPPEPPPASPPDLEAEAFARGLAQGRTEAMAERDTSEERRAALRGAYRALDQAAMDALAGELAETVIALCDGAIADFTPDREALLARCHVAAERLGKGADGCTLHLHPGDLALIEEEGADLPWPLQPDDDVERGGLRFVSAEGEMSDTPADWRRAIAAAVRS